MIMHDSVLTESPRWGRTRRVGAAGLALATLLALPACKATGGGYIGPPLAGGVLPVDLPSGAYTGDANFGFNFTCEVETAKKRAVIKGQITYHDYPSTIDVPVDPDLPAGPVVKTQFPEIRLHGTVEPFYVEGVDSCAMAVQGLQSALFHGSYWSQDTTLSAAMPPGRFSVLVFDQGEPGHPRGDFTGDEFSIELTDGPYPAYTRGGYIEGGNIQVDDST